MDFKLIFKEILEKMIIFKLCMKFLKMIMVKVFETGNIIFADLKLSGINNSLYYFDKKGSEGHYDENGKEC